MDHSYSSNSFEQSLINQCDVDSNYTIDTMLIIDNLWNGVYEINIPHSYPVLYGVTFLSLLVWFILLYYQMSSGHVMGWKTPNIYMNFLREWAIYSFWWQAQITFIALTWHNNIIIDILAILLSLPFGGNIWDRYNKWMQREWIFINDKWNYFFSIIINLSHHIGLTYFILFESNHNKLVYRLPFSYAWFAHFMIQILYNYNYKCIVGQYDLYIWRCYHYSTVFMYCYWYIYIFRDNNDSDNSISLGLILLGFGRWMPSHLGAKDDNLSWRREGYMTISAAMLLSIYYAFISY